jgi:hypothetical protein
MYLLTHCLCACVCAACCTGVSLAEVSSVLSGSRELEELSLGSTGLSGALACELALPNLKVGVCRRGGDEGRGAEGGGLRNCHLASLACELALPNLKVGICRKALRPRRAWVG